MPTPRIQPEHTALLVVDLQERLLPIVRDGESVLARSTLAVQAAEKLDLPVFVTEQYPQKMGPTLIDGLCGEGGRAACVADKMLFSSCVEPIRAGLREAGVRTVLLCGIEAHVCVLQSCLDLLDAGYTVGVLLDAISSRREADQRAAEQRMLQAGAIPTTVEAAILEMVREAGTPRFKAVLPLIK